jgi:hypothetical protein
MNSCVIESKVDSFLVLNINKSDLEYRLPFPPPSSLARIVQSALLIIIVWTISSIFKAVAYPSPVVKALTNPGLGLSIGSTTGIA